MTHPIAAPSPARSTPGNVNTRALHMLGLHIDPQADCSIEQSVATVHKHLTYGKIERMRKRLKLERTYVVKVLEVSASTYERNLADKSSVAAKPPVTERALRLARIVALAEQVLEDAGAARQWLAQPQPGLGGRAPDALLSSEFGAREVEALLQRIDAGVYV